MSQTKDRLEMEIERLKAENEALKESMKAAAMELEHYIEASNTSDIVMAIVAGVSIVLNIVLLWKLL